MLIDTRLTGQLDGFRKIDLKPRLKELIRTRSHLYRSDDASLAELETASATISQAISGLADVEILRRLHHHNPAIFQVIRDANSERQAGFSAQLPLTRAGVDALVTGHFCASEPQLEHVAQPGEPVEAFYVWLTYSPQSFVATLAGLSEYLRRHAPDGATLFCTPLNADTRAFFLKCGYVPATYDHPAAPSALLMARRVQEAPAELSPRNVVRIEVARSLGDFAKVMAVRAATYMHEQECPFDEEFDGNDFSGTHLLGTIDGEPAGCIRIRYFADFVKFERLAVRREFRSSRLAFRLVREAMKLAARKGFRRVYGHSRKDIVAFWESFGFRPMPGKPTFSFSDVEYVEMEGPLPSCGPEITRQADPLKILRPEGCWDVPGVLERPANTSRQNRISSSLRRRA